MHDRYLPAKQRGVPVAFLVALFVILAGVIAVACTVDRDSGHCINAAPAAAVKPRPKAPAMHKAPPAAPARKAPAAPRHAAPRPLHGAAKDHGKPKAKHGSSHHHGHDHADVCDD